MKEIEIDRNGPIDLSELGLTSSCINSAQLK